MAYAQSLVLLAGVNEIGALAVTYQERDEQRADELDSAGYE